jgi:TPR repeat protein
MMSNLDRGLEEFNNGDYSNAFALLMPIAEAGEAEAQCLIANMYQTGSGIERNVLLAIQWYEKSADQGYGVASNNLGEIFFTGADDIFPDREKARFWYEKATQQGFVHTRKLEQSGI